MPPAEKQDLASAIARLESRWGSASVRLGAAAPDVARPQVSGALALAPAPQPLRAPATTTGSGPEQVLPTGFGELDALLGMGGLPQGASASFRGSHSSGKTSLALHCLAQAQAQGAIAAFLDFSRSFDPFEAACRGVDLRWLLVLRPANPDEGFALAAALLGGHGVDLLVLDLPSRLAAHHESGLRRLSANARRQSIRLLVLEPAALGGSLHATLAQVVSLRLELEQRAWLRAGRDVIGRCVAVTVAKNRFGPPGRQAELEIRYPADGEHFMALDRYSRRANRPA